MESKQGTMLELAALMTNHNILEYEYGTLSTRITMFSHIINRFETEYRDLGGVSILIHMPMDEQTHYVDFMVKRTELLIIQKDILRKIEECKELMRDKKFGAYEV